MFNKTLRARAVQVAGSLTLSAFAVASQADPISLTGVCHLSSIIAGQARCDIYYQLSDDFSNPGSARRSQIKIDNILVAQYVNDDVNPLDFQISAVSGTATVSCGVTHTVTAYVAPLGAPSTPYVKVGSLPPIRCPTAP